MSDYVPTDWVDDVTEVDAARMNHLEAGVDANRDATIVNDGRLDAIEPHLVVDSGRISVTSKLVTDWNLATQSGWYKSASSATNKPIASTAFLGLVIADSANFLIQIAWAHNDAQTAAPRRWIRTRAGAAAWGAWYQVEPAAGGSVEYENAWAAGTAYTPGDVVIHNGIEYLAVNPSTGQTPPASPAVAGATVIPLLTALPASPFDGQEVDLTDSLLTPSWVWRFRYVAAAPTNKWKFVGGAPMSANIATPEGVAAGGAFVNLATIGPSLTIPVTGLYLVEHGAQGQASSALADAYMSYAIGAAVATDADGFYSTLGGGNYWGVWAKSKEKNFVAGDALVAKYRSVAQIVTFRERWMTVTPRAVS